MKELSIEEKAKAYDEALEKSKRLYEQGTITESLAYIFPELKESEDERIRKALVEMVHDTTGDSLWIDYNVHKEEAIAWLEKQGEQNLIMAKSPQLGEQKPTDETPYPETLEKAIDLYYYSYGNGKGEFEHLSLEKFRDIVYTFVSDYGQKPAWSEEDEDNLNSCIEAIEACYKWDKMINWLKSLKQRIGG